MSNLKYFENYMEEIVHTIDNGSIDELITLAKEYNINSTTIRIPSRQNDVVKLLKQKFTEQKIDWTTL